jgi:hypothetical protein
MANHVVGRAGDHVVGPVAAVGEPVPDRATRGDEVLSDELTASEQAAIAIGRHIDAGQMAKHD